jgi:phosphomannomutase / phosphoglucomutase
LDRTKADQGSDGSRASVRSASLQTGEPIPSSIFRAYDIRGIAGQTLTPGIVYRIGRSIGSEAHERRQSSIVVGRDGRLSGESLAKALVDGLGDAGLQVVDIGVVPTPVLYFATHHLGIGSGVMVTGSHNPPDYNGLKIVLAGETLAGDSIQALRRRIEIGDLRTGRGERRELDLVPDYIQRVVSAIDLARSMRVVLDCGNGVAGAVAPALFRALGCDVVELFCAVDGHFPNHHPDPSQPENLEDVIGAVRSKGADVGLAFDGDGDRLGVVDDQGTIIWPDRQMMLYAGDVLAHNPGAVVIYDVKCTAQLDRVITEHGGHGLMWKTGHSLIKARLKETGALLAGEMSGHIFFRDGWYGFDDALYSGARLLRILARDGRRPSEVFSSLPNAANTPELHLDMGEGEHFRLMARLLEQVPSIAGERFAGAKLSTIDGLRVDFADRWGLVRASNTTPCLVLRFEGATDDSLERIKQDFRALLRSLDCKLTLPF